MVVRLEEDEEEEEEEEEQSGAVPLCEVRD